MNNPKNKFKFILILTAIFAMSTVVTAQEEGAKSVTIEKMAKKEKNWFKVTAAFNIHAQYPELQKTCSKLLFKQESESLQTALEQHLAATYDEAKDPDGYDRTHGQKEDFVVKYVSGKEGKFLCYTLKYEKVWNEKKEAFSQTKTYHLIYDVVHGKVLSLSDVLVPEKVAEIKAMTEKAYVQMIMDEKAIAIGRMKGGKLMTTKLVYTECADFFAEPFKQLLDWTAIEQAIAPQKEVAEREQTKVFDVVEEMPSFGPCTYEIPVYKDGKRIGMQQVNNPGGGPGLMQFLGEHIHYPAIAEENGIQGRVVCQFVVERDGSISNITVMRSVDPSLDKEAVRVLKLMPKWNPGKQNGQPIRVNYTVPVQFRLQ